MFFGVGFGDVRRGCALGGWGVVFFVRWGVVCHVLKILEACGFRLFRGDGLEFDALNGRVEHVDDVKFTLLTALDPAPIRLFALEETVQSFDVSFVFDPAQLKRCKERATACAFDERFGSSFKCFELEIWLFVSCFVCVFELPPDDEKSLAFVFCGDGVEMHIAQGPWTVCCKEDTFDGSDGEIG